MKTPHKHAELIKAWADGAEIEAYSGVGKWVCIERPEWYVDTIYRIKPEPKPDVVRTYSIVWDKYTNNPWWHGSVSHNLKLTFDGETGKLKSAEVL